MATAKITGIIQAEKKELIGPLLQKANLTADDVIDSAFTQWIRANLDLLADRERKQYQQFLITKNDSQGS